MVGVGALLDALQLPPDQLHGQHLVLVAAGRARPERGESAKGAARTFFYKAVWVGGGLGLEEGGGQPAVQHLAAAVQCNGEPVGFVPRLSDSSLYLPVLQGVLPV